MADIRGVLFQGRARVVREPGEALELAKEGARARGVPESEWPTATRPGVAYIRMTPVRTVSWDYGSSTSDQGSPPSTNSTLSLPSHLATIRQFRVTRRPRRSPVVVIKFS